MPSWQGKSKGNKLGYSIFVYVLRYGGGVRAAYVVLYIAAAYYFLFSHSSSRAILKYFNTKIGYGRWRSLRCLYSNYYVFGQTLIDKVVVMAGIPNPFTFEFDGEQHLHDMVAGGKGGILLSAHLGNWEVAGHLFTRLKTKINIVMFDGEHEQVKSYLSSITGERVVNVIVLKNDLSHIYAIADALNKQELVCMHADRFMPGNKTVQVPFLGEEALFPMGPFQLASTFKVPVSLVFAFKETSTHYHLYATPPREYHGKRREGIQEAIHDFATTMEEKVKQYPVQWFNYYDFWDKSSATPTGDKA
ncbi:lipid A biosynthesis acyltransferase [uncultured Chitinophaga sp.]|uniref:LpxL/LpxP family acyltransferase n=1 Tax=uncultured Chitinophaga sp. TaxID=339340 RepID=UPI0025FFF33F|nr:lipid A biosynthesis acyltransferase [uncultured Chitinophaga sp.]